MYVYNKDMKQPCLNVTYVKQSERMNENYCNGMMHAVGNENPGPQSCAWQEKKRKTKNKNKQKTPAVTSVRDKSTRAAKLRVISGVRWMY